MKNFSYGITKRISLHNLKLAKQKIRLGFPVFVKYTHFNYLILQHLSICRQGFCFQVFIRVWSFYRDVWKFLWGKAVLFFELPKDNYVHRHNTLKKVKTSLTASPLFQSCLLADKLKSKEHSKKVNKPIIWLQSWKDIQFPNRLTLHGYYFGPQKNFTYDI